MLELQPYMIALAGGFLPVLAWLWFFLREDSKHPEPKRLLFLAFIAGGISVALAIAVEQYVALFIGSMTMTFIAWSIIEEIIKFIFAYGTVLRLKSDDEPIDPVIYMVTVALGFAAVENTLFLLAPMAGASASEIVMTGNLRAIGATLLHVLTSAVVGACIGLAFYKKRSIRIEAGIIGLILACVIHGSFNYFVLQATGATMLQIFGVVWIGIVILIALLEYIKRIRQ